MEKQGDRSTTVSQRPVTVTWSRSRWLAADGDGGREGRVSSLCAALGGRLSSPGSRSPHHHSSLINPSFPVRLRERWWPKDRHRMGRQNRTLWTRLKGLSNEGLFNKLCYNWDTLYYRAGFLITHSKYLINPELKWVCGLVWHWVGPNIEHTKTWRSPHDTRRKISVCFLYLSHLVPQKRLWADMLHG